MPHHRTLTKSAGARHVASSSGNGRYEMSDESQKATTQTPRKAGAPQFDLSAFAHRLGSQIIHDYNQKKRNRRRNKVAARSRTVNRQRGR